MEVLVRAPMLGKILRFVAQPGQQVDEDETVMIMEAMKMEIDVSAPAAGTVSEYRVAPGDSVNEDDVVAIIQSE